MSDRGDHIIDEKPIARSIPALVTSMISGVVSSSAEISVVATNKDVLEKVITSVIQLTTNRIRYLRHFGRFWFPLSSSRASWDNGGPADSKSAIDSLRGIGVDMFRC